MIRSGRLLATLCLTAVGVLACDASTASSPTSALPAPAPAASATTTAPSARTLLPRLAGHVITRIPTTKRVVALTFDGGAGDQGAASILRTLRLRHVRASFFLTGSFAKTHPSMVRRIVRAGHIVGNHSLTHPHMTRLTRRAVRRQVLSAERILAALIHRSCRPWFRFPFGEYDARTVRIVNRLGYAAIGWTVDSQGWRGRAGGTVTDVVHRVLAARQPGEIVLMHLGANPDDHTTFDAAALPRVISRLRRHGYTFVTLSRLLP